MDDQQTYELIERYLEGELEGEELQLFKERMEADAAFAQRVRLFGSLENALGDQQAISLQSQLAGLGERFFQEEAAAEASVKNVWSTRPAYRIAAVVAVLMAVGITLWMFLSGGNNFDAQQFTAAELAVPYEFPLNIRGEDEPEDSIERALAFYLNGEYGQAQSSLQILIDQGVQDQRVLYALGLSFLQGTPRQVERAKTLLQQVVEEEGSLYHAPAQWYIALLLLEEGKKEEAKEVLAELAVEGARKYAEKAKRLQEQIK